jgi:hypothetical protein
LGEWLQTVDLEPAFVSLHRHRAAKYHHTIAPGDFRNSLQELDGAFLSYSSGFAMYLNPSIKEFVASVLSSDPETAEDLLMSAVRFKQVVNIWQLSRAHPESELQRLLAERPHLLQQNLLRLLYGPSICSTTILAVFNQFCYVPKHTVGEQLLQVREAKREQAAYDSAVFSDR